MSDEIVGQCRCGASLTPYHKCPLDERPIVPLRWRVGGKVPLNVYEGDTPMFQCHTPEHAARIVKLLNAAPGLLDVAAKAQEWPELIRKLGEGASEGYALACTDIAMIVERRLREALAKAGI